MTYQLIVMSFDGQYKTEPERFENTDDTWTYSEDIGSKWYFYPFHFVVDQAGEVVSAQPPMGHLEGMTIEDVAAHFAKTAAIPEAQGADVERFSFMV